MDELRDRAITLRRQGLSRSQIRARLALPGNAALTPLLEGEPPPAWTKRPNAKDGLRARARELRAAGKTYDEILAELGVSKSSVSLWVRDLPKPATSPERARRMAEARWAPHRAERALRRRATSAAAQAEVGDLSDRELFLIGVGLYWAEGAKSKPYARREIVTFFNSDANMITVYLAWLRLMGVKPERLRFQLQIHETADVASAERHWAQVTGAMPEQFGSTTLKRHKPLTNRKNTGAGYHGCLGVRVLDGADLYRRIEGWWTGIVVSVDRTT
jgi:transcriptional regulator with XRE-family HTH domain